MINDPIFSNVSQWAEAIRNRRISASEALRIHLAQIDKFNPTLKAINLTDAEKALERARAADEAIARGEFGGLYTESLLH